MQFYYESCSHAPTLIPPTLPIHSRMVLFGDFAYELLRTYNGVPFGVEKHFDRLLESLSYLNYDLYPALDTLYEDLSCLLNYAYTTLALKEDLCIRIHFGRSEDDHLSFQPSHSISPTWFYICMPLSLFQSAYDPAQGLRLGVSSLRRWSPKTFSPAIKTGNCANTLLGSIEAKERGYDDAVFLDSETECILEASNFNVMFLDQQGICIVPHPHSDKRYLLGVSLSSLLENIPASAWRFEDVSIKNLSQFRHCLALSTTRTLQWVAKIEDHAFDPVPEEIQRKFEEVFGCCVKKDIANTQRSLISPLRTLQDFR